MTLSVQQSFIIILVIILGTVLTRTLPFIIFPSNTEIPRLVLYLGELIPYAAIGMLIVYCLKGISVVSAPYGIPEGIAVLTVVLLHLWKKNTLLSIGAGTLIYMLLVQTIFI
jgi:branched-subunit amino acid transport protein AzlD